MAILDSGTKGVQTEKVIYTTEWSLYNSLNRNMDVFFHERTLTHLIKCES